MNRKITDLALALSGMCGGLGASGFSCWRRAQPLLLQHRAERQRAEAAEGVAEKFAAVAGDADVFGHTVLSSRTETR